MTTLPKQPPRQEGDGVVRVERIEVAGREVDDILICAENTSREGSVRMSEYNAWRVFGMLALMLSIPLPPRVGKAIQLGDLKAGIK